MAIYSFSPLSSTSYCLIWKIEESLAGLYPQLHPLFLADFHSCNLSSKDRIEQSLAVRVALYFLLKKLDLPIVTLSKNKQGRPLLENSQLHLSFTHTRYVAAVALSTSFPIGIDIETIKPQLRVVQAKILTEEESKHAHNCLEKLAIYWSAKEALYKRLDQQQSCRFKDIFIEPFPLQTEGKVVAHLHQKKYTMVYKRMGDALAPLPHFLVCATDAL